MTFINATEQTESISRYMSDLTDLDRRPKPIKLYNFTNQLRTAPST